MNSDTFRGVNLIRQSLDVNKKKEREWPNIKKRNIWFSVLTHSPCVCSKVAVLIFVSIRVVVLFGTVVV
jgi:hypothetical protein